MNMVIFIKKDHFLMWIIFEIFKCRNSSYLNPNSEILSHWLVERFLFRWSLFNFKELIIYLTCLIFNFFFFLKIMILTHIGKSRKLFPKNGRWLKGYPGNFFPDFAIWGPNFKARTIFFDFQNAGRQDATRETITGDDSQTEYCVWIYLRILTDV